ncbi:MAG: hypothetical protein M3256_11795 [Actinomycetota bacterium]|nr:hypothetical protein [Actinomycetota bacterium]MDQ6946921.1 hypothetical protein [Actinomycetota bacterium]
MPKKRLLAAATMTAALGAGGLAGFVLGAPGVSSAQTTTTTPSADAPTTAPAPAPAPGSDGDPAHDCPNMGGRPGTPPDTSSSSSGATNTGLYRGGNSIRTL